MSAAPSTHAALELRESCMVPAPFPGSTIFPLRRGLFITIEGLPADLDVHDVERIVRWLRMLPPPGSAPAVCPACRQGLADQGSPCPACGAPIPTYERDASEAFAADARRAGVAL